MVSFDRDWLGSIDSMQREMERLLNYLISSKPPSVYFAPRAWEPAIDIYEKEREIVVLVELAGVKQDEIEVIIERSTLVVRGVRASTTSQCPKTYHQMEIHHGPFERGILLPAPVEVEQAKASYENGLLEIVLPKLQQKQILKVKIAGAPSTAQPDKQY